MNRRSLLLVLTSLPCFHPTGVNAQTVPLDPVVVTALRAETTVDAQPFSTRIVSGASLRATPSLTLDSALRSIPSFSLFRRADSLTAHPTTQGVSLRGLGPSEISYPRFTRGPDNLARLFEDIRIDIVNHHGRTGRSQLHRDSSPDPAPGASDQSAPAVQVK